MKNDIKSAIGEPIAIVGMSCIFPGAPDLQTYWQNIVNGKDCIEEVPSHRWGSEYYDPNSNEVDRFYCRRGGFVDRYVDFDPLQFGVMPKVAESTDPDQLLSLRVGIEALKDAGYSDGTESLKNKPFDREKTGVIIGRGNYLSAGTLRLEQHVRQVQQTLQTLRDLFPDLTEENLQDVKSQLKSKMGHYGPDTAVGLIPNLVASRLANRLDLHGPAYTVDAACASSLIAVEQACQQLRSKQCNMMLAGGLHFTHDLTFWATFCQLGALSRKEKIKPLSEDADGILAGEGIGMLVLKRVSDAENDGDRIYALINGVGSASDGRSSSLLAPAVEGQLLSLQRAWSQTDIDRSDIGLVEAHGTGTPAGDNAELDTLAQFFGTWDEGENGDGKRPGIGSVKSMIGHTMPAAGVAGIIKSAMSIYHGVLPPSLHCERPNPKMANTRFRVIKKQEPWKQESGPRVAAVNAFGFGGINAHAVLSMHISKNHSRSRPSDASSLPPLVVLYAESQSDLIHKLELRQWGRLDSSDYKNCHWRLVIVRPNSKKIKLAKSIIEKGKPWSGHSKIYFSAMGIISEGGKVAFLFPGVDSSFEPQAEDICQYFNIKLPEYCESLKPSESLLKIWLGLTGFNRLLFDVVSRLGVTADGMAGHSIGEWSAMAASGMLSQALVDTSLKQKGFGSVEVPDVNFLAAGCGESVALSVMDGLDDIVLSHDNCPHQVILCGKPESIEIAGKRLTKEGVLHQTLSFSSGFHTPLFSDFVKPYDEFFSSVPLTEPRVPMWSSTTCLIFPENEKEKQRLAVDHLLKPIRFRELLENMYGEGYRVFLQIGTGSLPGFVSDTLKGRPHVAMPVNVANRSGMEQMCNVIGALWVEGADIDTSLLCEAAKNMASEYPEGRDKSSSSIKLNLGVPIISLDRPLALPRTSSVQTDNVIFLEGNADNALQGAFNDTLREISRTTNDMALLWKLHSLASVPFSPKRVSSNERKADFAEKREASVIKFPDQSHSVAPFTKKIIKHLDINGDIDFISDHSFYPQKEDWPVIYDWHPIIPLTMELMLLKEAVEAQLPDFKVVAIENAEAFNWLIVDTPIDVEISVNYTGFDKVEVGIAGYIKAVAVIAREYPGRPLAKKLELKNLRETAITSQQLYQDNWMFHGPAYQGIVELGPIADNGIKGRLKTPSGVGALLDNMGQLAGYWVMEEDADCLAMPIGIEKISFYCDPPKVGENFDCEMLIRELSNEKCVTDQQLVDSEGKVCVGIDGWKTRRYQMDRRFWMHSKQIQKHLLSHDMNKDVVVFKDNYDTAITRDYMEKRYLVQSERESYAKISPRRRRQWLNGRIAAKDAVRKYVWKKVGEYDFYPKEIEISSDGNGKPEVKNNISKNFSDSICISIAHKDKYAVATAAEHSVGVDIEVIESRSKAFIDLAFSASEQAHLQCNNYDELVTRFWVSKECVAKQSGLGFEGKPKDFVVEGYKDEKVCVNGQWVFTTKFENYIVGWTE